MLLDDKPAIHQQRAVEMVLAERDRQDELWGAESIHDQPMLQRLAILAEEFGEFAKEVNDMGKARAYPVGNLRPFDDRFFQLRDEAVQTAAVALTIVEALEAARNA